MKKIFTAILSGLLSLVITGTAAIAAEAIPKPTDLKYVNDYVNVIDEKTKSFIISLGKELEDKTGAQAVVIVEDSLNGSNIRNHAYNIFKSWGIGQKDKNNGLLIYVAIKDRKFSVEVGTGLEGAVTDVGSSRIMDEVAAPRFKEENYSEGIKQAYAIFAESIAKEYDVKLEGNIKIPLDRIKQSKQKNKGSSDSVFPDIIMFFIILIFIGYIKGRNNRGGKGGSSGTRPRKGGGNFYPYIYTGHGDSSSGSDNSIDLGGFGGGDSSGGGSSGGW